MTAPQSPVSVAPGSGSSAGRGPSSSPGPSGRHELLSVLPRIVGDLSFGRAVEVAERIERVAAARARVGMFDAHHTVCPLVNVDHHCAHDTRMDGTVLVRPVGTTVGGDAA